MLPLQLHHAEAASRDRQAAGDDHRAPDDPQRTLHARADALMQHANRRMAVTNAHQRRRAKKRHPDETVASDLLAPLQRHFKHVAPDHLRQRQHRDGGHQPGDHSAL